MSDYLHLPKGAEEPYQELVRATMYAIPNCTDDPETWDCWDRDGYRIPTNEEAQALCAGCPIFEECQAYAEVAKPAIGIYAGKVYGAGLVAYERSGLN